MKETHKKMRATSHATGGFCDAANGLACVSLRSSASRRSPLASGTCKSSPKLGSVLLPARDESDAKVPSTE